VRILLPTEQDVELPPGFDRPGYRPEGDGAVHGRGGARRVVLPSGKAAFYRPYRHGGVFGGLQGDRYLSESVLSAELRAGLRLLEAGVPVAVPIAGRVERRGLWKRLALLTEACEGRTLDQFMREEDPRAVGLALRASGRAVASMQRAGFRHADLHPGNLIVSATAEVRVLDLARGRFGGRYGDENARRSLVRCARFLFKREQAPSAREVMAFLQGYAPDARALRHELFVSLGQQLRKELERRAYGRQALRELDRATAANSR
jgi:tRNA A-37 threonylcarbamoyl transferase component Bud32